MTEKWVLVRRWYKTGHGWSDWENPYYSDLSDRFDSEPEAIEALKKSKRLEPDWADCKIIKTIFKV